MKQIYLSGLLGLFFLGMNATPSHMSPAHLKSMAGEGKARELPYSYLQLKRTQSLGISSRNDSHSSFLLPLSTETGSLKTSSVSPKPLSVVPGGSALYGYLTYEVSGDVYPGICEMTETGYDELYPDPVIFAYDQELGSNGWYVDGKIQGIQVIALYGYLYDYFTFSYDFETGENIEITPIDIDSTDIFMLINAYNPEDGKIYGYAYNFADNGDIYWVVADYDNVIDAQPILNANDNFCYSLCYNPSDGYFYGVNLNQDFVKIDLSGNQSIIDRVPNSINMMTYITGIAYDPVFDVFYWNYNGKNDTSGLYGVSPDGEFEFITSYANGEEFSFFFTTQTYDSSHKPNRPEYDHASFEGSSLSGTVTFTLPVSYGDGSALPATLEYTALLDGDVYTSGSAAAGSEVTVDYTVRYAGFHTFSLYVTADGVESSSASTRIYIGNDMPLPPTGVKLSNTEITWNAVTGSVNGGYIDLDALTYIVMLNGEKLGETAETSFAINIPEDEPLNIYEASVVAVCNGIQSRIATSNRLVAGSPYEVPMNLKPTEQEFELMIPYDANGDEVTWDYFPEYEAAFVTYTGSQTLPMDDYLFLPPVEIESTDSYYSFSLESALRSASYPKEFISVVYATAPYPEAIGGTIIETFTPSGALNQTTWELKDGLWYAPAPGTYYLALHCTSAGDQYGLLARNFSLVKTEIVKESPSISTDLTAVAASGGVFEASLSFKFPEVTMGGDRIPAGTSLEATVTVAGLDKEYKLSGTPGSTGNVVIETIQGNNTINILVSNGELLGPVAKINVYTGISVPALPTNIKVVEAPDMKSAVITWDPVTNPYNEGGYIIPENITYSVYLSQNNGGSTSWKLLESGIKDTSYTFTIEPGTEQEYYTLGLASFNEGGSSNTVVVINNIYLGTIMQLPIKAEITEEGIAPAPWYRYNAIADMTIGGGWFLDYVSFYIDGVDEETMAMVGYASGSQPFRGAIGIPRFTTRGYDEVEIAVTHNDGVDAASLTLYGDLYDSEELTVIGSYNPDPEAQTSGMTTTTFRLPENLLGKEWVQVYIVAEYENYAAIFIMSGCEVTGSASISSVKDYSSIRSGKESIIVKGYLGKEVTISTLAGVKVAGGIAADNEAVYSVSPGIYVVKAGNQTTKLIVK